VSQRRSRGFTLIEMMVSMAIVVVLAALAVYGLQRLRPRTNLATVSTDLYALLRNARANAMATGRNTIVMVFPQYQNPQGGRGRVIVFEDEAATFFRAATAPNFQTLAPDDQTALPSVGGSAVVVGGSGDMLQRIDFPRGLVVGGGLPVALTAPFARVNGALSCGFCSAGLDGRGAVQYDSRGRATFHNANGAALDLWGAALSLQAMDPGGSGVTTAPGVRTLVLTSTTGGVRTYSGG
jgi:prepilin-type N-terminal cleavage/methylation domain-containing protein